MKRIWEAVKARVAGGRAPALDPAVARALASWRAEIAAARERRDRARLEELRDAAPAGVPIDDIDLDLERIEAAIAMADLEAEIAQRGLPVVDTQHKAISNERCHLIVPAFLANDGVETTGTLLLTERRLLFLGPARESTPWHAVRRIALEGRDVVIVPARTGVIWRFRCNTLADAGRAAIVAGTLAARKARQGKGG